MSDYYTQETAALKTIIHDTCKITAKQGVINSLKNDSGENYVTDTELSNNYLTKEAAEETYVNKEEIDYVIETHKEDTTWYRKYKSGWIEQGGQITCTETGTQTVTILPMVDANYWVSIQRCGTVENTNNVTLQYQQVINTSTTEFSVYFSTESSTSTATIRWMVSGYSASE